jgi:hypothetical protein
MVQGEGIGVGSFCSEMVAARWSFDVKGYSRNWSPRRTEGERREKGKMEPQ